MNGEAHRDGPGYAYDAMGNRKTASESSASSGTSELSTYAANSLNQYAVITNSAFSASPREISPTYDLNGNMTWDGTNAYFWDLQNQLILVSNFQFQVSNAYDAMGRRVRKIVSRRDAETQSWEVESARHFYYDGWNVIRETIHSTLPSFQSSTNLYTWGLDIAEQLGAGLPRHSAPGATAGGVGGLLAVSCVSSNTSTLSPLTSYPLYDHNGNVECYVSRSGATVAAFQYDAFGNTIAQNGPMANDFVFRFSTKYWDAETGLSYYGYRFYRPGLGRWVNRDPINEAGGINLMVAFFNNPLRWIDGFGFSNVTRDPCKICVVFEREDKGVKSYVDDLKSWADGLSGVKLIAPYYRGVTVTVPRLKKETSDCGVVAIVGHGSRRKKAPFKDVKKLDDYTTLLDNIQDANGAAVTIDDLFNPNRTSTSILDPGQPASSLLVLLATCNNGYAPEVLPNGSRVERLLPNWQDKDPLRPSNDIPDLGDPPEPGGTMTGENIRDIKARVEKYKKDNCCP